MELARIMSVQDLGLAFASSSEGGNGLSSDFAVSLQLHCSNAC